jgi:hypothetical protein
VRARKLRLGRTWVANGAEVDAELLDVVLTQQLEVDLGNAVDGSGAHDSFVRGVVLGRAGAEHGDGGGRKDAQAIHGRHLQHVLNASGVELERKLYERERADMHLRDGRRGGGRSQRRACGFISPTAESMDARWMTCGRAVKNRARHEVQLARVC